MKCLLIDDEPKALEILRRFVERVHFLEFAEAFRDPVRALAYLAEHPVDLVFLDVNMPGMSGIQFLNALRVHPLVIFTTAYSEYALEGYDLDVVDYLLKPIEFERFLKAVNKAHGLAHGGSGSDAGDRTVLLKSGNKLHHVRLAEIHCAQAAGNYVAFCTEGREILALMTMKEAVAVLSGGDFVRVHRSYVVNLRRVEVVEDDVVVVAGRRIPVAEGYRDQLIRALRTHRQ